MWRFKILLFAAIIALLGSVGATVGAKSFVRPYIKDSTVDLEKLNIDPNPTYVYDVYEDLITKQKKEKKYRTKLSEVPKVIQNAFLATEDRYFYIHPGINPKSLFRAGIDVIRNGSFTQGGSTITQQLVKEMYLTKDKELERKIREINMALTLESQMSKEKIFENYMNHIYYGQDAYGIKDAVRTYFGQSFDEFEQDDEITKIAKAAMLAGLVQRPSDYDPYKNPSKTLNRRNDVLAFMLEADYINEKQFEKAIALDLMIAKNPQRVGDDEIMKYGEIIQYIFDEASTILDMEPEEVRYSGVKIYTSFDPDVYSVMRKHYDNPENFHPNASDGTIVQSGAIFANPQTGEIIALTGGRKIPEYSEFNHVYSPDMKRQPGSTFKPISVYAPALNTGKFHPWSQLYNNRMNFGSSTQPYVPENWNGKYTGYMSMTEALRMSMNVPAVWTLQKIGVNYAKEYLKSVGIDLTNDDSGLSMALGGLQHGVSPLQMADAFQPFANGGHRIPLHMINRIVTSDGEVIYEANNELNSDTRVLKEEASEYMRYMLENAINNGTGGRAKVPGQMIAGKTGSTQSEFREGKDNDGWFVGFNKHYVGAIWMGYDVSNKDRYLINASSMPSQLFGEIMKELTKMKPDPSSNYSKPVAAKPKVEKLNMNASYNEEKNEVTISWDSKEETSFQLFKNNKAIGKSSDSTSYTDKDLKPGDTISYKVVGYNVFSEFPTLESSVVTVSIPGGSLATPSGIGTESSENSFDISWFAVEGANAYRVVLGDQILYDGPDHIFTVSGLEPDKDYTVSVIAYNDSSESDPAVVTVKTLSSSEPEEPSEEPTEDEEEENTNP